MRLRGCGQHPQGARFAGSSSRMCYAQAKAAMLSASRIKARFAAALTTVIYYYCVSHRSYAVKGFASLTLALLKQVFSVDSPDGELSEAKTSFRTRALRVTRYAD
jgi:hypothetical protein